MPRYAIQLAYDGSRFVGYQVQPNGPSIQANLDAALIKMAKCPEGVTIPTVASGRTDSGVHALGQVVHFDYPAPMPQQAMQRALNALLDPAIKVVAVARVADDFHARYHAVGKEYRYRVDVGPYANPFKRLYSLHHPYRYDLDRINQALEAVVGTHDFTSFCSTKTDKEDKVRTVHMARVWEDKDQQELVFQFQGTGFLYNMIRILVGTSLQIGDGLRPVNELERLIQVQNRKEAGPTAPPQGLYLQQVFYEPPPFNK